MSERGPSLLSGFVIVFVSLLSHSLAYNSTQDIDLGFPDAPVTSYYHILSAPGAVTQRHRDYFQGEGIHTVSTNKVLSVLKDAQSLLNLLQFDQFAVNGKDGVNGSDELYTGQDLAMDAAETLLQSLSGGSPSSVRCVNDTGHLLVSMVERKGWALKFLDATGKPGPGLSSFRVNFVGDYDLCRSLVAPPGRETDGFTGNYVTLKAFIGDTTPDPGGNPLTTPMIQWGVCMPSTCSDEENTMFVSEAIQRAGLNHTLSPMKAETHNDKREATVATGIAIVIVIVIGSLVIAGTFYDILFVQLPVWKVEWAEAEANSSVQAASEFSRVGEDAPLLASQTPGPAQPKPPKGKLSQTLIAFSVYTNGSKVLNTTQPPGSITCLHGIRFLSMCWVILGHSMAFGVAETGNTASAVPKLQRSWAFMAVASAFSSVDTFFTLSGLLLCYVALKGMQKTNGKVNWFLFYFHRFWRLTPPYMLSIALCMGFAQYFGQGPLWPSVAPTDTPYCKKNWWSNLLYINNLIDLEHACFGHTWYLANDMQFFWLSPLMLIPLFLKRNIGLAICGVFILVNSVVSGVLTVQNNWPTDMLADPVGLRDYFDHYYVVPWCRIGPFVVGILAGYLLVHRPKVFFKMSWRTALIGWLVAAASALAIVYGVRGDITGDNRSSTEVAAVYNAVSRTVWGVCVSWVILSCVAGRGGFVNTFLSWSPFVVLGRLTYMAYLLHPTVIDIYYRNLPTLHYFTTVNIAATFMAILVASYVTAFIAMLALESPMIGLEKVMLPSKKKH